MYIVNCFIDGQKGPCLLQAYKTLEQAEKRAKTARETYDFVKITYMYAMQSREG